jgi:serine/threonine protein kinase
MIPPRRIEAAAERPPGVRNALGRFDLVELVGLGGTSTVYRAHDLERRDPAGRPREVAIKLMRADASAHPDLVRALHIEARRLVDFTHPNIVEVFGSGQVGDHHYLAMEFLHGRTLAAVLKDRPGAPLPPQAVFRLVREIASGLAYAHARGLVHGDLKPGNVLVCADGRIKLLDFGTARAIDAADRPLNPEDSEVVIDRLGAVTPAYASPEALSGEQPCEGDDVFSLAVMSHLMLTGGHPFGRASTLDARREGRTASRVGHIGSRRADALLAALSLDEAARRTDLAGFVRAFAAPDLLDRLLG